MSKDHVELKAKIHQKEQTLLYKLSTPVEKSNKINVAGYKIANNDVKSWDNKWSIKLTVEYHAIIQDTI